MIIENFTIDNAQDKVFVIAEIGMNHNGSMTNAIKLIDQASIMGADCVKFQMRNLKELYSKDALAVSSSDLSTQYTMGLLQKFELSFDQYQELALYSRSKNLVFMCTPWDKSSVDALEKIGVPAFKTASADLTNFDLLAYLATKQKPIILSTGMSLESEIASTVKFLQAKKCDFALLHCNSTYPAPFKDINLRYLETLKSYQVPIGYSGHERDIAVSLAAVAMGARIIERHFSLDRNMEGPDHSASLEFDDFKALIQGIRQIELALGKNLSRTMSQGEMINRETLAKSIFAKVNIEKGTIFSQDLLEIKSPGQGLSPQYLNQLIGKKAIRDIMKGKNLFQADLDGLIKAKQNYKFKRPWGMPVRFHDLNHLLAKTSPKLVEFHMSFKDLEEDLDQFLDGTYDCDYTVHTPELFANDHLLDLCTEDKDYRKQSIKHLQNIVAKTLLIKNYFPNTERPKIIIHCGGFTKDAPLESNKINQYYINLIDSLSQINADGVELLPENMAPFPWLFGGQRFQNIFINADEIIDFCQKTGFRICQDISHSFLACNKFNWNHLEYTKKLAPYTAHYHISDGNGVDGEGLQIGKGNIDFSSIYTILNRYSQDASFIPEIWQGHKNEGEGFWISLERLEGNL